MEITNIILICFAIFLYYVLTSKQTVEHLRSDPRKPEKCFYDYELIALHGIFVLPAKDNLYGTKEDPKKV